MAGESSLRKQKYNRDGCNSFNTQHPKSAPLSFWTEKDIWDYIDQEKLDYSSIYDKGYKRTGCMFCLFGYHLELRDGFDRLKLLEETHPKQYRYCLDKMGMREVLEWYPELKTNKEKVEK